ncbi:MAG: NAD(P)/FAD-dependent oxidoreductase [Chitinophagales bacterium]
MDLVSGQPYWLMKNGILHHYASLTQDHRTDVLIIGGGITGAITAHYFTKAGLHCTVIEKRHIGMGSTCSSTSLIQYEIDTPLSELIKLKGENASITAYRLSDEAVTEVLKLGKLLQDDSVQKKTSLYFSSSKKDVKHLREEYIARKGMNLAVSWLNKEDLKHKFNLSADAAILSENAAMLDAYSLTHKLLQHNIQKGLEVFALTEAVKIKYVKAGIHVKTQWGNVIKCNKLIYATGYESQEMISKKIVNLNSTFAFITQPIETLPTHFINTIFWETARPYLYFRSTNDKRLIIGGMDSKFKNAALRSLLMDKRAGQLKNKFQMLYPALRIIPDFTWAGTFGETKDGLPYIGTYKNIPHTYFACGFGGNGITFSMIAAQLIRDQILQKQNPYAQLFSFNR